jgi:hypothetical protein
MSQFVTVRRKQCKHTDAPHPLTLQSAQNG